MDEAPGRVGEDVANKPRDSEQIRQEVEQTREELGDTVEALAQKADVKGQAKQKVSDIKERVAGKKDDFTSKVKEAAPESSGQAATQAARVARENRLPLAIGGAFVAGFLLGKLTSR